MQRITRMRYRFELRVSTINAGAGRAICLEIVAATPNGRFVEATGGSFWLRGAVGFAVIDSLLLAQTWRMIWHRHRHVSFLRLTTSRKLDVQLDSARGRVRKAMNDAQLSRVRLGQAGYRRLQRTNGRAIVCMYLVGGSVEDLKSIRVSSKETKCNLLSRQLGLVRLNDISCDRRRMRTPPTLCDDARSWNWSSKEISVGIGRFGGVLTANRRANCDNPLWLFDVDSHGGEECFGNQRSGHANCESAMSRKETSRPSSATKEKRASLAIGRERFKRQLCSLPAWPNAAINQTWSLSLWSVWA